MEMPVPDAHTRLSRRERESVNAVFALENRASAEEIRGRPPDPPSYSAVRAMLVRLGAAVASRGASCNRAGVAA